MHHGSGQAEGGPKTHTGYPRRDLNTTLPLALGKTGTRRVHDGNWHFEGTKPEFLAEEFFIGKLDGWAAFESLIGGLQKRATSPASWPQRRR